MANIDVTNARAFIPEIWSKDVLFKMQAKLVMAKLVSNLSADVKFWDTLHVPIAGDADAQDKVANVDVTFTTSVNSSVPVLINKHKAVPRMIEDIARIQSVADLRGIQTQIIANALAKAVDTDLIALYSGLTQHVGTYGTDLTEDTILAAKLKLDLANVPDEGRSLVIRPEQENVLLKIDRFTSVDKIGANESIKNWQIGRIHGFDIFKSTQVVKDGVGRTDSHNLAFHTGAFALAIQLEPRLNAVWSIDWLGWKVVWDMVYGVAEVRDDFAVEVRS